MENRPDANEIRMQAFRDRGCPVCGKTGAENFKERDGPFYLLLQPRILAGSVAPVEAVSCLNCRHIMLFGKFG